MPIIIKLFVGLVLVYVAFSILMALVRARKKEEDEAVASARTIAIHNSLALEEANEAIRDNAEANGWWRCRHCNDFIADDDLIKGAPLTENGAWIYLHKRCVQPYLDRVRSLYTLVQPSTGVPVFAAAQALNLTQRREYDLTFPFYFREDPVTGAGIHVGWGRSDATLKAIETDADTTSLVRRLAIVTDPPKDPVDTRKWEAAVRKLVGLNLRFRTGAPFDPLVAPVGHYLLVGEPPADLSNPVALPSEATLSLSWTAPPAQVIPPRPPITGSFTGRVILTVDESKRA